MALGPPRRMKIIYSCGSASCHSADESRLLLRLKQVQLFEAVSGPCAIAIAHIRWTLQRFSTGTGHFFKTGPAMGLEPLDAEFCTVWNRSSRRRC